MISGYGIEFTTAGAEIAEDMRRLIQAFSSLCVASAVFGACGGELALFTCVLESADSKQLQFAHSSNKL